MEVEGGRLQQWFLFCFDCIIFRSLLAPFVETDKHGVDCFVVLMFSSSGSNQNLD